MRDHTIVSWNVAGLLGLLRKAPDSVRELIEASGANVVCLQETKLTDAKIEGALQAISMPEWHVRWSNSCERRGYCGVMTLSREKPLGEDSGFSPASGRFLAVEFDSYILVNVYVPNSGRNLVNVVRRLTGWDPDFRDHVLGLRASGKPVIVAGDMNVAPEPIDVYDPVRLRKTAGFTAGERASYCDLLERTGMVDSWRETHPGTQEFSFFSNQGGMRGKGLGWRLDHILVPSDLIGAIKRAWIGWTTSSDHNPVGITLSL
jgi:exodeoxyribonuclease-3